MLWFGSMAGRAPSGGGSFVRMPPMSTVARIARGKESLSVPLSGGHRSHLPFLREGLKRILRRRSGGLTELCWRGFAEEPWQYPSQQRLPRAGGLWCAGNDEEVNQNP